MNVAPSADKAFARLFTERAIRRLLAELEQHTPSMARHADEWTQGLARTGHAADYFQHPLAFPMLLLPLWVEETVEPQGAVDFQADLIYSSVSGYYFIRMIDNAMDEKSEVELRLLPLCGFFHAQAIRVYHKYFPADHEFWPCFARWNALGAELAIVDGASQDIDLATFKRVAGQKVVAGKIPLAAVLGYYGRLDRLPQWETFYDLLSCWHQLFNDVLSWQKDSQHHNASYFLSEGRRRKRAGESVFAWLIREGFAWGFAVLREWLAELLVSAESLGSAQLQRYLVQRGEMLERQALELKGTVGRMAQLIQLESSQKPGQPERQAER